ncbi:MFS general substrate transporter [Aureobasidium sp. EXF-10728]|nr:MFS general substrate transporter [Aureobasidium sp. EXF-10728]
MSTMTDKPVSRDRDLEDQNSSISDQQETKFDRGIPDWKWYLVCVGIYTGALLYGLDTTIAADVQGPILEAFGDIEKLSWVGIGFPMASVSIVLLVGALYALFEIKWMFISSLVLFEVGSALCGAAPDMNALIVGRVIAGMGGAGMYLGALTYITTFTSKKEQPIYNALIGLCWGTGCILGPVIGGGFAVSSATWRWAFYINLPLAGLISPVYLFLLPTHNPKPDVGTMQKLGTIDWLGAFLFAGMFAILQVALTFSGSLWKWNEAGPIALWVVFAVFLLAFMVQQGFSIATTPSRRLFPVHFLKSRTMILLYTGTAASSTGLALGVYYIPIFFQFTKGDSPIKAAVRLLPYICVFVTAVMLSGGLLPLFGRYQICYMISGVLLIIGGALMHTVHLNTSTANIYGYEVLMAFGAGTSMQVAYSVAVAIADKLDTLNAVGFINVAQIGSLSIGLSIAGCLYQNLGFDNIKTALLGYQFSDTEIRAALGGAHSAVLASGDLVLQRLVLGAIAATLRDVWVLTIVAGAVALVSGLLMKREKLNLEMTAGG